MTRRVWQGMASDSVKRHLPIEYAADLTSVVAAKGSGAMNGEIGADQDHDDDALIILNLGLHLAVHLVLNLPLHTSIATASKRTADFNAIDRPHHHPSGPSGA